MSDIAKSLAFDPVYFGAHVVLFITLLLVMNSVFWTPMLAHLKKRDQAIRDAYLSVEDTQRELETLRLDYQNRIKQEETDAHNRIQSLVKEATTERDRLIAEARAEADALLRRGTAEIEGERVENLNSLRGKMVSLAGAALSKAVGGALTPEHLRSQLEAKLLKN